MYIDRSIVDTNNDKVFLTRRKMETKTEIFKQYNYFDNVKSFYYHALI